MKFATLGLIMPSWTPRRFHVHRMQRKMMEASNGSGLREWYAVFEGDLRNTPRLVKRGALGAPDFGGFVAAASTGNIGDRLFKGMWIVEANAGTPRSPIMRCGTLPRGDHWGPDTLRTIRLPKGGRR